MKSITIPSLLEAFFNERLKGQMQASPHTIASYSDTFQLLLQYATKKLKKTPSQLALNDFNAKFLCEFLDDLEESRKICARRRNARLVAIRSFFRYLSYRLPGSGALILNKNGGIAIRASMKCLHYVRESIPTFHLRKKHYLFYKKHPRKFKN